jgi:preprotein translocase subunit SecE
MGNATVSQVTVPPSGDAQPSSQGIASWPDRIKEYFSELQAEMRKVHWPTKDQVMATTGVVIAAIFAFAAYFFVVDLLINAGIDRIFRSLAK